MNKSLRVFFARLYCWSKASVVIGIVLLINQIYFPANILITAGLSILSCIYFISVFDPNPVSGYDWTLVFPELIDDDKVHSFLQEKKQVCDEIEQLKLRLKEKS